MPLMHGKSGKAFTHNIKAEYEAGKPLKQSLAIAYNMKRKSQKMAQGGMACQDCASGHCSVHGEKMAQGGWMDDGADMVDRIMKRRMSEGGRVSNEDHGPDDDRLADFSPNEFDDLALRDDLESDYTGANSGDEIGNAQEDEDRSDIVSRIMKSRRMRSGSYPGSIKMGL